MPSLEVVLVYETKILMGKMTGVGILETIVCAQDVPRAIKIMKGGVRLSLARVSEPKELNDSTVVWVERDTVKIGDSKTEKNAM